MYVQVEVGAKLLMYCIFCDSFPQSGGAIALSQLRCSRVLDDLESPHATSFCNPVLMWVKHVDTRMSVAKL